MGKMRIFVRSNIRILSAFYTFKIRRSAGPQIRILPPASSALYARQANDPDDVLSLQQPATTFAS